MEFVRNFYAMIDRGDAEAWDVKLFELDLGTLALPPPDRVGVEVPPEDHWIYEPPRQIDHESGGTMRLTGSWDSRPPRRRPSW